MTHISIKAANTFAEEMVREALAHPNITAWYPNVAWQHFDITSNDAPAATIVILRHGERETITAHCEMEFENNKVVRGIVELIVGRGTWSFSGYLVDNRMEVHGTRVVRL